MTRRMLQRLVLLLSLLVIAAPMTAFAADAKAEAKPKPAAADSSAPVVTHHEITINGKPLKYTVTTGKLPIKNDQGETEAEIFFMAYTADRTGGPETRPLMFSFNGGPGSASV